MYQDKMKTITSIFSALCITFLFLAPLHAQNDRSSEIAQQMASLDSPATNQRIKAAKIIARSGFDNEALYQKIARILEAGYTQKGGSKHIDEMAWMCKALAASGDIRYTDLLTEVARNSPNRKLQGYAKKSVAQIGNYAKRKEVMGSDYSWNKKLTDEENRLVSMLRSGDHKIMRDAAKIIYRGQLLSSPVYQEVAQAISSMQSTIGSSRIHSDTLAWLCKALSTSGDAKYAKVLQGVIDNSHSTSLTNHAQKSLANLRP